MAQIASVDYANLRILLHIDTVTQGFDPAAMQKEYRALRRTVEANRRYDPMVSFSGNESKGGGKFTPGLTLLRSGVRIVPYDPGTGSYSLDILNEILSIDDGISDRDVFDRSTVVANVDIDPVYSPVEVREVVQGSAVTPQDITDIKNAIFDETMEGAFDFRDYMLIMSAVLGGEASGFDGANGIFKSLAGGKNRVSVTTDEFGNRTSVTFDLT